MKGLLVWLFCVCLASASTAADCRTEEFAGNAYTICEVDAARQQLELFLRDDAGDVYGYFGTLSAALEAAGKSLGFAMNAGMYHDDRRPVGLYVEGGKQISPLVARAGPGNFGLLPNGVLCLSDGRATVWETRAFQEAAP
ncbi:MAG: hypothetical protein AAF307_13650, partial [Pseudomonadota bacterium]